MNDKPDTDSVFSVHESGIDAPHEIANAKFVPEHFDLVHLALLLWGGWQTYNSIVGEGAKVRRIQRSWNDAHSANEHRKETRANFWHGVFGHDDYHRNWSIHPPAAADEVDRWARQLQFLPSASQTTAKRLMAGAIRSYPWRSFQEFYERVAASPTEGWLTLRDILSKVLDGDPFHYRRETASLPTTATQRQLILPVGGGVNNVTAGRIREQYRSTHDMHVQPLERWREFTGDSRSTPFPMDGRALELVRTARFRIREACIGPDGEYTPEGLTLSRQLRDSTYRFVLNLPNGEFWSPHDHTSRRASTSHVYDGLILTCVPARNLLSSAGSKDYVLNFEVFHSLGGVLAHLFHNPAQFLRNGWLPEDSEFPSRAADELARDGFRVAFKVGVAVGGTGPRSFAKHPPRLDDKCIVEQIGGLQPLARV